MLANIPATILSVVCAILLVVCVVLGVSNNRLEKQIVTIKNEQLQQMADAAIAKKALEDKLHEALNKEVETVVLTNLKETVRVEHVEKVIDKEVGDNPTVFTNVCLTEPTVDNINKLIKEED